MNLVISDIYNHCCDIFFYHRPTFFEWDMVWRSISISKTSSQTYTLVYHAPFTIFTIILPFASIIFFTAILMSIGMSFQCWSRFGVRLQKKKRYFFGHALMNPIEFQMCIK